ncbi:substrate-binding domain-containing protein [Bacillus lacus]|uniref:Substrate-binding domain-containing protein n=1 Tax=Metabacillus lacus TaxID=1983721 RepID=A0A7X2IXE3_9BACI|nr:LacI family DNA-binding transcriptional regulator [Metabacillus lacus]MRX71566.1 substrate-binding domain-containing protein [Metabacillus lacus]
MKPTIKDIAGMTGVSVATVSRILNDQRGYSEETKERVEKAIKELGYKPNAVARNLVNRKSHTIGVLIPKLSTSFSAKLLQGIEAAAHQRQYSVLICNTDSNGERTMDYIQLLNEKQVDGVIFASELFTREYCRELLSSGIPAVVVSSVSVHPEVPYIKINDEEAAYAAAAYLIEKGHQNIGMISGTKHDPVAGMPRLRGFQRALKDYRLQFENSQLVFGDFSYSSGYRAIEQLLEKNPYITGVFAASDEMALGVISYCYEKGIRIPDHLSVVGFDDTEIAQMSTPPLTTVHQPIEKMGSAAFAKLASLMNGEEAESSYLPFQIIERGSAKRLS